MSTIQQPEPERGTESSRESGPHVVVGVDGSPGAARALEWAAEEASTTGARLVLVGAWVYGGDFAIGRPTESDAHLAVEAAMEQVAERHPGLAVERRVPEGMPALALIEASAEADLLVVGSRGLGGFRGLLLGSVGQHCLVHASCPVAIVRYAEQVEATDARPLAGRVVVGVDGSARANLALGWAVAEAHRRRAELEVISAWLFPTAIGDIFTLDAGIPELARQIARDAVARAASLAPDLVVHGEAKEDPPAVALVDASTRADLVVVGPRGVGSFRGMLLGSVSLHLAHHAACPVVVVKDRASTATDAAPSPLQT